MAKTVFEGGEAAFATTKKTAVTRLQQEVQQLEEKLIRKDEVLGEVMEEYVTLKKCWGALTGEWVSRETRDEIVTFVQTWQRKTGYDVMQFTNWLGIGRNKYYSWVKRQGQENPTQWRTTQAPLVN
ncbi:MAG: hypothetical protein M5U34_33740 [Chloroflexi bacterium]|nr:hypothetical protein [Chloroflexota bacterium]